MYLSKCADEEWKKRIMGQSEELISLAVDLALVGEQVELIRMAMERLVAQGYSFSSPEVLEANAFFSKLSNQFLALEEQYEICKAELLRSKQKNVTPIGKGE